MRYLLLFVCVLVGCNTTTQDDADNVIRAMHEAGMIILDADGEEVESIELDL